jgi:hypothetical protein
LGQAPEFNLPDVPRDLTILSDQDLMILFSEFVNWQNFAATKLSEAEVEETRAEASQRIEENIIMMGASKGDVVRMRASMSAESRVVKARQRFIEAYAARKMTSTVFSNCERVVNLVSRELTRRVSQLPSERRNSRWNP